MLLALVTGIFYFTMTVTGLSMSAGLLVLIIGIPFFLLFVGFTRVLALAEGRLVEGLLGQRMPRRPLYPVEGRADLRAHQADARRPPHLDDDVLLPADAAAWHPLLRDRDRRHLRQPRPHRRLGRGRAARRPASAGGITLDDHAIYNGPSPLAAPFLLVGGVRAADGA